MLSEPENSFVQFKKIYKTMILRKRFHIFVLTLYTLEDIIIITK